MIFENILQSSREGYQNELWRCNEKLNQNPKRILKKESHIWVYEEDQKLEFIQIQYLGLEVRRDDNCFYKPLLKVVRRDDRNITSCKLPLSNNRKHIKSLNSNSLS